MTPDLSAKGVLLESSESLAVGQLHCLHLVNESPALAVIALARVVRIGDGRGGAHALRYEALADERGTRSRATSSPRPPARARARAPAPETVAL